LEVDEASEEGPFPDDRTRAFYEDLVDLYTCGVPQVLFKDGASHNKAKEAERRKHEANSASAGATATAPASTASDDADADDGFDSGLGLPSDTRTQRVSHRHVTA